MKLDPEIAAMLEAARAYTGAGVGDLPLAEARTAYRERYRARGIAVEHAVETEDFEIPVPKDGASISARLYRAPGATGSRPVALYFHGGGFLLGDTETYDNQSRMLAALSGVDILFIDYRRAPENRFPAPVEDAVAALLWASANAGRLALDPARIGVAGDSAGGNLAVNAALAARDAGGPPVAAQILLYPVTDFRPFGGDVAYPSIEAYGEGFFLDRTLMDHFARHYLNRPEEMHDPRASPLLAADLGRLPPAFVVTAGHDPLRDQGHAFFEALRAAGTPAQYLCMEGMVHNFMGHAGVSKGARRAFEDVAAMLADALK
jgi:acetyl esterase